VTQATNPACGNVAGPQPPPLVRTTHGLPPPRTPHPAASRREARRRRRTHRAGAAACGPETGSAGAWWAEKSRPARGRRTGKLAVVRTPGGADRSVRPRRRHGRSRRRPGRSRRSGAGSPKCP